MLEQGMRSRDSWDLVAGAGGSLGSIPDCPADAIGRLFNPLDGSLPLFLFPPAIKNRSLLALHRRTSKECCTQSTGVAQSITV